MSVKKYLRRQFFPQMWCPGCGHGIVMGSMLRAIDKLGLDQNEVMVVSGIGCSSRLPGYLDFHTMHTLHGRALAFATGVKMGRPDMTVLAPMGDGDSTAIGGNHLIHAARRNINITAIIMNNNIYGMTGGQSSPTTPLGARSTTAQDGVMDQPFDVVRLVTGAGASFVARCTTYHTKELIDVLAKAISHKGFSLVEVFTQCPTYYGRKNKSGNAADMMLHFKEITAPVGSDKLKQNPGLFARGIIVDEDRPEFSSAYAEYIRKASGQAPDQAGR